MFYKAVCRTEGNYLFTLGLYAFNEKGAKNKAKKISQGCTILDVKECIDQNETMGISKKMLI